MSIMKKKAELFNYLQGYISNAKGTLYPLLNGHGVPCQDFDVIY